MKNTALLFVLFVWCWTACVQPPDYPIEPEIEFVSLSKSDIKQNVDTFSLTFSYTDGDGDIGIDPESPENNVIITDSRTGSSDSFRVPVVPQQGAANGISGEITILVFASCCLNSNPICQPTLNANPEEMTYSVQMFDRAGNASNVIQTSPIMLICN